jgi:glycosyltransferase involved in cell wall biosynthesis
VTPGHLAVVVPARNEEDWLPACLASLDAARLQVLRTIPRVQVSVTVVLDRCTDGSERLARGTPGVSVISGSFGSVGAARHAGVAVALARSRSLPVNTWVANTDADTTVPRDWLVKQYRLATDHDLVLGTVRPVLTAGNSDRLQLWADAYSPAEGHGHIHGANLGIRGSTYGRVGGFRPLTQDEDVDLVTRAKAAGARWTATASVPVSTSSRTEGRVPAGFSTYLRDLGGAASH